MIVIVISVHLRMKELKSSVGLGGKPLEGGEEVRQDDDYDDDGDDDEEEEDDGLRLMIEICCYRWQVQPLDLILNL